MVEGKVHQVEQVQIGVKKKLREMANKPGNKRENCF
jgi:hypothetical protein